MVAHKRKSSHDVVNGNKRNKPSKLEEDVNPLLALLEANQVASLLDNDISDNELEAQREQLDSKL